jgi:diguanylate cyclase (GGDEF)-like protein
MINFGFVDYCECIYELYAFVIIFNIVMISSALTSRIEDVEINNKSEIEKEHEAVEKLKILNNEQIKLNEKLEKKIRTKESELLTKNIEDKEASSKDNISGFYTRSKLEKILTNELHRVKRYQSKFSTIVINMDGMMTINTKHGEQVGDSVIKEMVELFMKNTRFLDAVGRWDENEFIIICPQTDARSAIIGAERLRKLMEQNKFFFVGNATASFGVTDCHSEDVIQDIIKRGYEALKIAKEGGKNRVEVL